MRTYSPKASEIQRVWYIVDAEGLEKRGLHVPRTEGLVEVPHAGDDVGAAERGFLGLHIGRKGMKVGLAEGSLPHSIE